MKGSAKTLKIFVSLIATSSDVSLHDYFKIIYPRKLHISQEISKYN